MKKTEFLYLLRTAISLLNDYMMYLKITFKKDK